MHEAAVVVVVPCYNEERRLDAMAFVEFARAGRSHLHFVDDGSTDQTARLLRDIRAAVPDRVEWLSLPANQGKAEAVRRGMLWALDADAAIVAYCDADLSTPLDEIDRLVAIVEGGSAHVALGSRVALMGARIDRRWLRSLLGRAFARAASCVLGTVVYDTQCGAKCFRSSSALRAAIDTPFLSRWAFDVELIGRLISGAPGVPPLALDDFVEIPLRRWREVGGGKLTTLGMAGALIDLVRIRRELRRRRAPIGRLRG